MSNIDVILISIRNLFKHKLRTFLTILGVVVGTSSIVIMISLGIAMNESFAKQLDEMGDLTILQVYNPSFWGEKNDLVINNASINDIKKLDGVKSATAVVEEYLKFKSGRYTAQINVKGIDAESMEDFGYVIADGRLLNKNDENELNFVFGCEIPYNFEKSGVNSNRYYYSNNEGEEREAPKIDVLNDKIQMSYNMSFGEKRLSSESENKTKKPIKPYNIKVIGLLQDTNDYNTKYYAFMPINQLEKIKKDKARFEKEEYGSKDKNNSKDKGYESLLVKCIDIDSVSEVSEELRTMGYEVYSEMDYVNSMKEIAGSLQALLGAIGGVSLFISAIGITNTMIMAIYERTREIGIMKVIGATLSDIKRLFLLEAVIIGFMGGIIGIILSYGVSMILNNVQLSFLSMMSNGEENDISVIPIWLSVCSLIFSSMVGLVSGYFPARRAMKLSSLSAIKTE